MAHQSVLLLLLLLLPFTTCNESSVNLFKQESLSPTSGLIVTLQCTLTGSILGNKTFFREINGNVDMIRSTDGSENVLLLTFELTPSLEGFYYCQVGNVTSNKLQLVGKSVELSFVHSTVCAMCCVHVCVIMMDNKLVLSLAGAQYCVAVCDQYEIYELYLPCHVHL